MIIEDKIENFLNTVSKAQSLCEGVRYDWEHHHGGVVLYDRQTGKDVFLQPGDDSEQFLNDIEDGDVDDEVIQDTIKEYFTSSDLDEDFLDENLRYTWEKKDKGILLTDRQTGKTIHICSIRDINQFMLQIRDAKTIPGEQRVMKMFFNSKFFCSGEAKD